MSYKQSELQDIMENVGKEVVEFKSRYDSRVEKLEKQLENVEVAFARSQFPGGGSSSDFGMIDTQAAREHRDQFMAYLRKGGNEAALRDLQVRAELSTMDDPAGGFTVIPELERNIDRVLSASSAMRRVAQIKTITTGEYKRLISQGGTESGWATEKASRDETDSPELAQITINASELFANPKITQTLLDDSAYDVAGWLENEIATEFAEQEGEAFINGNGVGKPKGLLAYDTVANASYTWGKLGYIAGGHATLLNNADKLISLQHALKPAYQDQACWIMNASTLETVRKFKDGEGNYLWRPGLLDGAPEILLGKPVFVDEFMDDIGAGKYPIAYGNFQKGYLIVERKGISILRDPYSAKPYVYFYSRKRVGGAVIMYEAIRLLKIAVS